MKYINRNTSEVKTLNQIRKDNPTVSIGQDCSNFGWDKLVLTTRPEPLANHYIKEGVPVDGVQQWSQVPHTDEALKTRLSNKIQSYLDKAANVKGYDDILSACSYASVPNVFQTESIAFVEWRSEVWSKCYELISTYAVKGQVPSFDDVLVHLPIAP